MNSKSHVMFAVVMLLATTAPITAISADDTSRGGVTLKGIVLDSQDIPVSGATAMIWTAGVKQGYSTFCPSCYADCGKRATTDANGEFTVANLSRDLKFRLLIVKEGFEPTFVKSVDPLEKHAIAIIHRRQIPSDPMQVVRGRVVDVAGNPVRDAIIEPEMVRFETEDGRIVDRWGAVKGLDPLAVSNLDGEFEIVYALPAVSMTLTIQARGLAAKRFEVLTAGEGGHELTLNIGATVRGRLVHFGRPVGNVEIGLVSQSRSINEFFREARIGTSSDGTFSFSNVPNGNKWFVYAKMESTVGLGTTDTFEVSTDQDGETIDVGDLNIIPGHRISGQVVLSDGNSIPEGMRMVVSCGRAWDSQTVFLNADGRFTVGNLRSDNYSISPSVKGYKLSKSNPNLSWTIEGLIDKDIDNFIIVLDPGKEEFEGRMGGSFKDRPLISASDF